MTVTVVNPRNEYGVLSNFAQSAHSSYASARGNAGSKSAGAGFNSSPGQANPPNYDGSNYGVTQVFLEFDTASIPDTDAVSSIVLELWYRFKDSATWDLEVREYVDGFGTSGVQSYHFVPGDSLASHPLVASKPVADFTTTNQYYAIPLSVTSLAGLKTGKVYLFLSSSKQRTGVAPTGAEAIGFWHEQTHPERLVITHDVYTPPVVEEVIASLPVQIGAGGELTDVAVVESVTTTLGVSVSVSAELTDVGLIEDLTTSLALNLTLGGELTSAPLEVEAVTASLPLTVDMGGTLATAPLGVPRVTSGVFLTVSAGGVLSSVTESVQSAQVALVVVIDGSGVLAHPPTFSPPRPQGRRATRPYVRTSTSRVYKSQSQSRRF